MYVVLLAVVVRGCVTLHLGSYRHWQYFILFSQRISRGPL